MTNENLRMQMLSGVITESEYKAKLEEKASLNESMIGGIVGIGAINQIPPRAKADYEMAFEHFLGERYEVKANRERDDIKDVNEEDKVEEGNLGHNETASLTPEGRFWIVSWRGMDGPKEKVFTDEDEARTFMNTLEEGDENLMENNGMNVVANILEMIKNGMGDEEIIAYMMENNFESEEQARGQLDQLKGALAKMKQILNPAPSRFQSQLTAMRDKYSR
jgi:plasmid stabilization system protein ParE